MKTLLFRAEKDCLHYIDCTHNNGSLTVGQKGKIALNTATSPGEKYQAIMDGLEQLITTHSPERLIYRSGQSFRGKIDELRYTNEAMLTYFAYTHRLTLEELTQPKTRKTLDLKTAELKSLIEQETTHLKNTHGLAKSDKILETLVFVSLLNRQKIQPQVSCD